LAWRQLSLLNLESLIKFTAGLPRLNEHTLLKAGRQAINVGCDSKMTNGFPEIVCTEHTLGGSPRIDGRRLAAGDVVSFVKSYGTLEEIIADYELTLSQIRQALLYCSTLQCKNDNPIVFCHNCSLRRQQEGPLDISNLEEVKVDDSILVKGGNSIFFGSMDELLEGWNGQDWWKIATDLLIEMRSKLTD
jgi:uncharacterized protein (DUF433 family)